MLADKFKDLGLRGDGDREVEDLVKGLAREGRIHQGDV